MIKKTACIVILLVIATMAYTPISSAQTDGYTPRITYISIQSDSIEVVSEKLSFADDNPEFRDEIISSLPSCTSNYTKVSTVTVDSGKITKLQNRCQSGLTDLKQITLNVSHMTERDRIIVKISKGWRFNSTGTTPPSGAAKRTLVWDGTRNLSEIHIMTEKDKNVAESTLTQSESKTRTIDENASIPSSQNTSSQQRSTSETSTSNISGIEMNRDLQVQTIMYIGILLIIIASAIRLFR